MTGPGARLRTAFRRMTVGLLAVGVAGLLAPVASATPESDADAAITAAFDASGGDGGPLGPRQGGVYPAGSGFGQDFSGGKMFFSPDTGAHFVQGAILDKYESLGGPAEGDLGFPTIDEGAGLAPDSRNSTFSAADKPVIFWTPDTGARVVRGALNAAWDKLGGSSGVLGVPSEDESFDGDVVSQKFTGGELSWNRETKAFTTTPPELADQLAGLAVPGDAGTAIAAARREAGGPSGPLGAKDGDRYRIGDAGGLGQNFAGGKILYSPETGANAVTGQVLEKYESVGGPEGDLGFPTSSETEGGLGPNSRIGTFAAPDKPVIFWTPDYGAVIVRGAMNAAWDKLGGAKGTLGAPMADQTEDGNVVTQRFSGGAISWDRSDNTFTTEPGNLANDLDGLEIPGLGQEPAPAESPQASGGDESKPFSWHWNRWWLIAVIPVVLLAGLIVGAALLHRRRGRRDDDEFEHDPFEDDDYDDGPHDDRFDGERPPDRQYRDAGYADGGYEQGGGYDEATTSRFAEPYRDTGTAPGGSPFDGPTDAAMPISQWAAPGGFAASRARRVDDEDEPPEESVELAGNDDYADYEADFVDDGDYQADDYQADDYEADDDESEDLDDIGVLDAEEVPDDERIDEEADDEADAEDHLEVDFEDEVDDRTGAGPAGSGPFGAALLGGALAGGGLAAGRLAGGRAGGDGGRAGGDDGRVGSVDGRIDVEEEDPDNVDTAPTPIVTPADLAGEAHSGRHAAIELDEPVPGATALHLPLTDPQRAPQGYPIKADTKTGLYWSPDSSDYDDAVAEIWFASEEFARTNGFVRAQ
ncbi:LGFP repeat-containing protein [Mycobacterium sp. NPDC003449]